MSIGPSIPVRELNLETYAWEDATVVRCTGRLTTETSVLLKTEVRTLLPSRRRLILDLTIFRTWIAQGSARWSGFTFRRGAQAANCSW